MPTLFKMQFSVDFPLWSGGGEACSKGFFQICSWKNQCLVYIVIVKTKTGEMFCCGALSVRDGDLLVLLFPYCLGVK